MSEETRLKARIASLEAKATEMEERAADERDFQAARDLESSAGALWDKVEELRLRLEEREADSAAMSEIAEHLRSEDAGYYIGG